MKKIELNQERLRLRKEKIATLSKATVSADASHAEPTTTVLHTRGLCRVLAPRGNA